MSKRKIKLLLLLRRQNSTSCVLFSFFPPVLIPRRDERHRRDRCTMKRCTMWREKESKTNAIRDSTGSFLQFALYIYFLLLFCTQLACELFQILTQRLREREKESKTKKTIRFVRVQIKNTGISCVNWTYRAKKRCAWTIVCVCESVRLHLSSGYFPADAKLKLNFVISRQNYNLESFFFLFRCQCGCGFDCCHPKDSNAVGRHSRSTFR